MVVFAVESSISEKFLDRHIDASVECRFKQWVVWLWSAGCEKAYDRMRLTVADHHKRWMESSKNKLFSLFTLKEVLADVT